MAEPRRTSGGAGATRSQADRAKYVAPAVTGVRNATLPKNDIDAGLTEAQRKAVRDEEGRVRPFTVEHASIIDKDGKVVRRITNNNEHSVDFSGVPKDELKDAVITHNHPQRGQIKAFGDTLATRIGSPLSAQDLAMAAKNDVAEMRATTFGGNGGGYTYSIKRPAGGWKITDQGTLQGLVQMTRLTGMIEAGDAFSSANWSKGETDPLTNQRASRGELLAQWHSVNEMAKALGATITRRRFK